MKHLLLALSLAALFASSHASAAPTSPSRPNIVVILADDMGFSDLGCFGSEIPTPNLDALAAGGVRFTQFYNIGRCCPTRASLLTGLYPHQAGVGHMVSDQKLPGYRGLLSERSTSIAEVLRSAGYFTAMTGKWHLNSREGSTPPTRGFDRSLSAGPGGFYFPTAGGRGLLLNGRRLEPNDPALPKDWYSTDLWTDFGLRFIDEAQSEKKPFFLYLAHNAPHFPLQAPAEDIARFRGKYREGWDKLAAARHERQVKSGLIDRAWPAALRPAAVKAWDTLSEAERDRFDHLMAIYAACVSRLDASVGRLVAGLKERGVFENTLIVFLSDNGGNPEAGPEGRLTGPGQPGSVRSTVFCGESWAWMQNTPFRRYKHFQDEGGIASPFIAHWPAGIAAHGEFRREPAHLIDIMATCLELAGATYPTTRAGEPVLPFEGVSLAPAFAGKPLARKAPIFGEHEGNAFVRDGEWKLVRVGYAGAWELYNMNRDRTEQHNLAAEHPERVRALAEQWDAWAKRTNVTPYPSGNDAGSLRILGRLAEAPTEENAAAKRGKKKRKQPE